MGVWTLAYHPTIRRDRERIPRAEQERIRYAIEALSDNPFPPAHRHLAHHPVADFRLRVGRYRILYDVDRSRKLVIVLKIAKRDDRTYS